MPNTATVSGPGVPAQFSGRRSTTCYFRRDLARTSPLSAIGGNLLAFQVKNPLFISKMNH
jgi:hypothetical protein